MDSKPKLSLLSRVDGVSHFWKCCPLNKEYLPESSCSHGKPARDQGKGTEEPACPWWLNSAEHNFCFWKFVRDKSDQDGVMKELVQSELAELFGWSNTKTHFMLKQAIAELTEALKAHGAIELLADIDSEEYDSQSVPDLDEIKTDDHSE